MLKSKRNYKPGKMDECQTPGYALDPLIDFLPFRKSFIDPAMGEGLLLKSLSNRGFTVLGYDIKDGDDFLTFDNDDFVYSVLITNPPFSLKYAFLDKCYELGIPFALLMPVETIGAKTAQDMFSKHGIEIVWFDKRINFKMPYKGWTGMGSHFSCAWFTWGLNIGKENTYYKCDHWTKEYRKSFEI